MITELTGNKSQLQVSRIVREANRRVMLVCPYPTLNATLLAQLRDADSRGVEIIMLCGLGYSLSPEARADLASLKHLQFYPMAIGFHDKFCANENAVALISANIGSSAQSEWGLLATKDEPFYGMVIEKCRTYLRKVFAFVAEGDADGDIATPQEQGDAAKGLVEYLTALREDAASGKLSINILMIGNVSNSQIQQGTIGSTQTTSEDKGRDERNLSAEVRALLVEASQDKNGRVTCSSTMHGQSIQTNGREFVEQGNPRSAAKWLQALKDLESRGLLEDRWHRGEVFAVTGKGYELADVGGMIE